MKPVTLTVSFTYLHEPDPSFMALPVPVELRAEVTISGRDLNPTDELLPYTEPAVEPLEKALWQDKLGPEIMLGAKSQSWVGAEEMAIEEAFAALTRASSTLPIDQRRAS